VIRELCLIKVAAGPNEPNGLHSRSQIFELANVFRARVVDLAPESIMLEMTGSSSKIEGLYYDLGTISTVAGAAPPVTSFVDGKNFDARGAIIRAGLNWRFGEAVYSGY